MNINFYLIVCVFLFFCALFWFTFKFKKSKYKNYTPRKLIRRPFDNYKSFQTINKQTSYLLLPDLIPYEMHGRNVRSYFSTSQWDKLRKACYLNAKFKCEICQINAKLECHEIWEFDTKNKIQKLIRLIALCKYCHLAKHIGRTQKIYDKESYKIIVEHMSLINHCSEKQVYKLINDAVVEVKRRNGLYSLDLTLLGIHNLIKFNEQIKK